MQPEALSSIDSWNDTAHPYPKHRCVHHLFEEQADRTPENTALVFENTKLSYAELNRKANRVAHHLRALGVEVQSPVAICLHRSVEMVVGLLGILKAGCPYVPIDPEYPADRIAYMLRDCAPRVVITEASLQESLRRFARTLALDADWELVNEHPDSDPRVPLPSSDLVYIIYTSGSTGQPKGAMNTHRGVVNRLLWMQAASPLTAHDPVLQMTPHTFDVSAIELFWPLICGAVVVLARPGGHRDPSYLVQCIAEHRISTLHFVPSMLYAFLEAPHLDRCACVKRVMCGGEVMGVDLQDRFFSRMKAELHNLYGPTEAAIAVTHWACRRNETLKSVPIGRPIWNTRIYILDEQMQPVPLGGEGELCISGDGVARGYLNRPQLTAEYFVADPFRSDPDARLYKTGDLGRFLADGSIEFLGRKDHQVKIRGLRIELGEIEATLGRHPLVHQSAVMVREDRPGDRRLAAYLIVQGDANSSAAISEIRLFLRKWLPEHMIPSEWVVLDQFPLTASGKVDRNALPSPRAEKTSIPEPSAGTELETRLAAIFCNVLGRKQIEIHDNFLELGMHSLQAMRVAVEIYKRLGVEVSIRTFFQSPTVSQLALTIAAANVVSATAVPQSQRQEQVQPLSFAQQRLWFLSEYETEPAVHNLACRVNLSGHLIVEHLRKSLQLLVDRHATLRTNFQVTDGRPVQVIAPHRRLEMPLTDLGSLPEVDRETRLHAIVEEEARHAFNLCSDLLFRAQLLKLSEKKHVLLLNIHHIVSDGWSMGVLFDSLCVAYRALSRGEAPEFPALPIQYADYAQWQRNWLRGDVLKRLLDYWRQQLDGAPPMLALAGDRPRPLQQSYRGAVQPVALSPELCEKLNKLSRQHGVTLYMSLLAAYALLLHRHSGQKDVVIGAPISGRTRAELEPLIGFMVNMLALRIPAAPALTVQEFLARVREIALEAYSHQDLPFERLVEELKPARSLSHAPIFQAVLVLQNASDPVVSMPDLTASLEDIHNRTAQFDLTMSLKETDGQITGVLEYCTDLFDAGTISRMIDHYRALLEGMVVNSDAPVGQLPMLSDAERHQLLFELNNTARPYPADQCLHQLFAEQARRTPESVALVCGGAEISYGELNSRSDQLSRYLLELRLGPGSLIAMCMERSIDAVVAMLGILKIGGAYVPLDCDDPADRLTFILADTGAPAVLTQESVLERLDAYHGRIICLDRDRQAIFSVKSERTPASVAADALAHIMYTSGSTGQPKGVEVSHRGIVRLICGADWIRFGADIVFLHFSPVCFDASTLEIWAPLLHGGRCIISDRRIPTPIELQRLIQQHKVTTLLLTPSVFNSLVDIAPHTLEGVEEIVLGGEAASVAHVRRAMSLLPHTHLINAYGPTENSVVTSYFRIPRSFDWGSASIPIGRTIANTGACILDEQMQLVPRGAAGEIHVGGAGLAIRYHNRPELTASRFVRDPFSSDPSARLFKTGDRARYQPDGEMEFLGRIDFQLKLRGYRIEPTEIELVLAQHQAVGAAVVVPREDVPGDKRLVAFVVLRREMADALPDIKADLRSKLPEVMVPTEWIVVERLPLNASGKVDRKLLSAPEANAVCGAGTYVAPATPLECSLAQIWSESLHLERVGIYDNLFELGGHSLLTVELSSRIEAALGIVLPLITFFRAPTIAQLAEVLKQQSFPADSDSIVPMRSPARGRPPVFCVPGQGSDAIELRDLVEHLGSTRAVYAIQPTKLDSTNDRRRAMEKIAALHVQSLRTIQPRGPYRLIGFSVGGLIAYEMACQLRDAGEAVAMLALIDTYAPGYPTLSPAPIRLFLHLREMLRQPGTRKLYLRHRMEGIAKRFHALVDFSPAPLSAAPGSVQFAMQSRSMAIGKALRTYLPSPYSGSVLLCRASVTPGYAGSHYDDPLLGWGRWLRGNIQSWSFQGAHLEMIQGKGAISLADALRDCLDQNE